MFGESADIGRVRIVRTLLALILASVLLVSCDSDGAVTQRAESVSPVPTNVVLSQRRLIHESELARDPALRADLVQCTVITRMESGATSGDLGQPGVDEIPYLLRQAETVYFKLETPNVSEAALLSGGDLLFTLQSGQDIKVWLPAGEYRLRLTGEGLSEADLATGFVRSSNSGVVKGQTTENSLNRTTPGVYIGELSTMGASVVGVDPGVTLLIGAGPGDPAVKFIQAPGELPDSFYGGSDTRLKGAVNQFFANGGANLEIIRVPSASPSDLIDGLGLFQTGPRMVVLPDLPTMTQSDADQVLAALTGFVKDQNLLAVLELPSGLAQPDQVQAWIQARPDFQIEQFSFFWPSPADSSGLAAPLAGAFARSAEANGVEQPPVGLQNALSGVTPLFYALNPEEMSSLGSAGVNALAQQESLVVCYGDSTAWTARTIAQRRTLDYLEISIKFALQSYVFAPNERATWVSVTALNTSFLQGFWQSGGLQGATAADAFSLACGVPATMSGLDILNGYMIVQVGVNLKPGSFVQLTFTQTVEL